MYHKSEFYNKGMLSAHPDTPVIRTGNCGRVAGRSLEGQGSLLSASRRRGPLGLSFQAQELHMGGEDTEAAIGAGTEASSHQHVPRRAMEGAEGFPTPGLRPPHWRSLAQLLAAGAVRPWLHPFPVEVDCPAVFSPQTPGRGHGWPGWVGVCVSGLTGVAGVPQDPGWGEAFLGRGPLS